MIIGQMLDRYRIDSKLGEGGMGVVYKAHDTHLDRDVAIKILPHDKVSDPARKQRFVQEAKAASALNHPGIVTVYDIRSDRDTDFIVMEYVGGKTLDQMIPAHGLRPAQALKYGVEIADALAKAHDANIIHRDLKPSNVMVTGEGRVKILDFGLAKLLETADSSMDVTALTAPLTESGMVVGTVAYMSPEQAEGHKVDARSDIFSFGAVLYEMVTGRKPFTGDSPLKVLSGVLNTDPVPPRAIAGSISPDLERIILRCLRKDPARRYQTMGDLGLAMEDVAQESTPARARAGGGWMWPAVAALLVLAIGGVAWRATRVPVSTEPLRAAPLTTLSGVERRPSFSPDGDRIAFSWNGTQQDNSDIYVQQIGAGSPLRLTTDAANDFSPGWSPDGRWIAFLRGEPGGAQELRIVPPLGGPERKLVDVHPRIELIGSVSLGWCPDSTCVLVTDTTGPGTADALFVVSLESGDKRQLTFPKSLGLDTAPAVSPDGKWLVFSRYTTPVSAELYRLPLAGGVIAAGEPHRLAEATFGATDAAWMPDSKEILFSTRAGLWRQNVVDEGKAARLPFVGEDGLMPAISRTQPGRASRLVYVRSYVDVNIWRIQTSAPGAPAPTAPAVIISSTRWDSIPELSPDGRQVAFASNRSGQLEIWLAEPDGSRSVQLTSLGLVPGFPRWSPDGGQVAFHADPDGKGDILVVPAAGGKPRNLTANPSSDAFPSFSRDGHWIYFVSNRRGPFSLWKLPTSGGAAIEVKTGARPVGGTVTESVDGASIYYMDGFNKPSSLWQLPVSGGVPVKVVDGVLSFAVLDRGIYYVDRTSDETRLQYIDFATRSSTTVARNLGDLSFGLSASPDGRTILYSRVDSSVDDLMLVENFR